MEDWAWSHPFLNLPKQEGPAPFPKRKGQSFFSLSSLSLTRPPHAIEGNVDNDFASSPHPCCAFVSSLCAVVKKKKRRGEEEEEEMGEWERRRENRKTRGGGRKRRRQIDQVLIVFMGLTTVYLVCSSSFFLSPLFLFVSLAFRLGWVLGPLLAFTQHKTMMCLASRMWPQEHRIGLRTSKSQALAEPTNIDHTEISDRVPLPSFLPPFLISFSFFSRSLCAFVSPPLSLGAHHLSCTKSSRSGFSSQQQCNQGMT